MGIPTNTSEEKKKKKGWIWVLTEARLCQDTSYEVSYYRKDWKRPMVRKDVGWGASCVGHGGQTVS